MCSTARTRLGRERERERETVRSTSDARCPSVCVCVCVTGSARMGELVVVSSELQLQWARMKRGIHLANRISTSEEQSGTFGTVLRRAIHDSVGRCRVQRKRAREAETPRDTSDAAIVRAARFTDVLPLDDYDNVLHLVPRLVNVVTVKQHSISNHPTLHNTTHTRAGLPPIQCVACAAGRGHPCTGVGHQAAARPARHCLALLQLLLRAAPVCGGAAGL